ncbi:cupin domain-containing protein [Mucilaginibacter flavidus]|uniref:cupin domain-containing protein n=1 Tax=Mucilaginibacter flavidus TaxID=2949309 RepID=UPI002093DC41|nr:cupin domain-containing protein [Mucilaginibacter flavidus]MCO5946333.1 cupin domain-containing protein [Mucilaginibacter flavidus]
MDVQKYIESGVLEQYCLGLLDEGEQAYLIQMTMLYPEIKTELTAVELAFEELSAITAVEPTNNLKQNILAAIGFNNVALNVNDLPVLRHSTNPGPWLAAFAHLIPDAPAEDLTVNVIRDDAIVRQMLMTGNTDVPEEEHGEFHESLFVLKGRCECTVGDELFTLGAGDFIEIPLNIKHDIKLLTPFVTAVLQYRFV